MNKRLKEYVNPKINKTRMITYLGLLIALEVVLTRFLSFEPAGATWRIGFGFIPTSVGGYLLGPIWGAVETALADVVGYFMFYKGSYPFHLGYTLSAVLRGVIYGLIIYRCKGGNISVIVKCILSVFAIFVLIDLGLNSYWSMGLTGNPYWTCLATNFISALGNFAIRCAVMPLYILFMKRNHRVIFGK